MELLLFFLLLLLLSPWIAIIVLSVRITRLKEDMKYLMKTLHRTIDNNVIPNSTVSHATPPPVQVVPTNTPQPETERTSEQVPTPTAPPIQIMPSSTSRPATKHTPEPRPIFLTPSYKKAVEQGSADSGRPVQSDVDTPLNIEKIFGKNIIGIVAAVLIFIGILAFSALVFPLMSAPVKVALIFIVSFALSGLGIALVLRNRNPFTNSLLGCGFGAIFVSIFATHLYFSMLSDIAAYILILLWMGVTYLVSRKLKSKVLIYLSHVGCLVSVLMTLPYLFACKKIVEISIYQVISSLLLLLLDYLEIQSNTVLELKPSKLLFKLSVYTSLAFCLFWAGYISPSTARTLGLLPILMVKALTLLDGIILWLISHTQTYKSKSGECLLSDVAYSFVLASLVHTGVEQSASSFFTTNYTNVDFWCVFIMLVLLLVSYGLRFLFSARDQRTLDITTLVFCASMLLTIAVYTPKISQTAVSPALSLCLSAFVLWLYHRRKGSLYLAESIVALTASFGFLWAILEGYIWSLWIFSPVFLTLVFIALLGCLLFMRTGNAFIFPLPYFLITNTLFLMHLVRALDPLNGDFPIAGCVVVGLNILGYLYLNLRPKDSTIFRVSEVLIDLLNGFMLLCFPLKIDGMTLNPTLSLILAGFVLWQYYRNREREGNLYFFDSILFLTASTVLIWYELLHNYRWFVSPVILSIAFITLLGFLLFVRTGDCLSFPFLYFFTANTLFLTSLEKALPLDTNFPIAGCVVVILNILGYLYLSIRPKDSMLFQVSEGLTDILDGFMLIRFSMEIDGMAVNPTLSLILSGFVLWQYHRRRDGLYYAGSIVCLVINFGFIFYNLLDGMWDSRWFVAPVILSIAFIALLGFLLFVKTGDFLSFPFVYFFAIDTLLLASLFVLLGVLGIDSPVNYASCVVVGLNIIGYICLNRIKNDSALFKVSEISIDVLEAFMLFGYAQILETAHWWTSTSFYSDFGLVILSTLVLFLGLVRLVKLIKTKNVILGVWYALKVTWLILYPGYMLTNFLQQQMVLSIACMLIALGCIFFGFRFHIKSTRVYGLVLTMASVLKIVIADVWSQGSIIRVIALIAGGIICFVISATYNGIEKQQRTVTIGESQEKGE